MIRINQKDDFRLRMRVPGINASARWEMEFYTGSVTPGYRVWYDGKVYHNATFEDEDTVIVNFDGHGLGRGPLTGIVTMYIPSSAFPDGMQELTRKYRNLAEFVDGPGDCPTEAEVEMLAPFIRGKDALEYAAEAGYEGDAAQFARDLAAVGGKVDKVEGKGLSANDYTDDDKGKVEALPEHVQPLIKFDPEDFDYDKETGSLAVSTAAKRQVFIDLWKVAGTKFIGEQHSVQLTDYNPDTELFTYDDVTFTYNQALDIYLRSWHIAVNPSYIGYASDRAQALNAVLPIPIGYLNQLVGTFQGNGSLKIVAFRNVSSIVESLKLAFYGCYSLIKIIGTLNVNSCSSLYRSFIGCSSLKEVRLLYLRGDISFQDSPQLSLASLQYMIYNSHNTAAITVTVHKDVYARIIDEGSGDWHALLEVASAKNISFATI